jgi:ADP-ribosyl-[dinitrogen reductase] hydrolase
MKLAPVALAFARHPAEAIALAALSARTTHGAPEAADAARCLAAMLVRALDGGSRQAVLDGEPLELLGGEPIHPKVADVVDGSFLDREPPAIRGGGYVVEALEAALWALRTTTSFEDGVLAAVNLGDDADTTGAIHGQLAGAIYGYEAIPVAWRERLVLGDEIVALADGLLELGDELAAGAEPAQRGTPGA